jgi:methionine sulfoxide reductase heme-binding subunit
MTNADWYLIRSSGVVSLVLLTLVMALGIGTTNRWRLGRRPRFATPALHRNLSLLSVVFVSIHVVTTLIDPYATVSLLATVFPFARAANAFWVGLGALSLDVMVALVITSLLRARLGFRAWRATHWLAYASWPLAFAHSVGMGSDAATPWFRALAIGSLATVVLAVGSRVLAHRPGKHLEPQAAA